jgi:uncharacterized protein (DUF2237 family)
MFESKNVLGQELIPCSTDPMTGFFRDGCCNTDHTDKGMHTVCVYLTEEFLSFSKDKGNDLSTPRPEFNFPGLKEGDRWCLCAPRWVEAYQAGCAPRVILEGTHEETLAIIPMDILEKFSIEA